MGRLSSVSLTIDDFNRISLNSFSTLLNRTSSTSLCLRRCFGVRSPHYLRCFQYFFNLKVLFIIVDAQPDLQSADNDMKVQRRWEFESTQGGGFFWNNGRGSFAFGNSKYIGYEALYRLIEEASKILGKGLTTNLIRSFEIRPVFAVRKMNGVCYC